MRASKFIASAVFGAVALLSFVCAGSASAEDIRLHLDQAFPIRLGAPASGVAVGNPSIAAVTVQDDQLLFITGRSYGSTNLIIVGEGGRMLYSGRVIVSPDESGMVMVTRGTETTRLDCSPLCRPRVDVGGQPGGVGGVAGR